MLVVSFSSIVKRVNNQVTFKCGLFVVNMRLLN